MSDQLSREELVDLVRRIVDMEGTADQREQWVVLFNDSVAHPAGSDLIFRAGRQLSPEEVVDEALSYRPSALPGAGDT